MIQRTCNCCNQGGYQHAILLAEQVIIESNRGGTSRGHVQHTQCVLPYNCVVDHPCDAKAIQLGCMALRTIDLPPSQKKRKGSLICQIMERRGHTVFTK